MACTLEPLDYSKSLDCSKAQSVPVCASQDILRVFSKQSCDAHLRATLPLALFALSQVKGVAMLARAEVCAYIAELLKARSGGEARPLRNRAIDGDMERAAKRVTALVKGDTAAKAKSRAHGSASCAERRDGCF